MYIKRNLLQTENNLAQQELDYETDNKGYVKLNTYPKDCGCIHISNGCHYKTTLLCEKHNKEVRK
jgi:hypothetical protein